MCGIAGIAFAPGASEESHVVVRRMADAIAHRGPDEAGFHFAEGIALGMRRLSIVDLRTGSQPIGNEDGSVQVVFNGMIYNYRDLRRELEAAGHTFATSADTEVIVHAYEQFGDACVGRLNGMFAFALWDASHRRLLLARDRLGKKPLHYAALPEGGVIFCSEIKGILCHPAVPRDVGSEAIDEYLTYSYIAEPRTVFRCINKVPAGHVLVADGRELRLERFWQLPVAVRDARGEGEVLEELEALLSDAIRIRLQADVPVGVLLSGGMDSSTILALGSCAEHGVGDSFSMRAGPGTFDELPVARQVAGRYGMRHHETAIGVEVLGSVPEILRFLDEPFADPSVVPTFHLCRFARQGVKVALSGDGGDELFAGYPRYRREYVMGLLDRAPGLLRAAALGAARGLGAATGRSGMRLRRALSEFDAGPSRVKLLMDDAGRRALYTTSFTAELETAAAPAAADAATPGAGKDRLTTQLALDFTTYLRDDLLVKMDRLSMANGLEVRSPLLDYRLVEFAFSLPPRFKIRRFRRKYALRRMMRSRLPPETLRQRKRGFEIPVHEWLRGPWRDFAGDLLLGGLARRGMFRADSLERLLQRHWSGAADHGHVIWALAVLESWFRTYQDAARGD
ncbi:MAG: asparagine synthase (glutamine-hydrolyzing) [Gemmatimonadales bacterium]